MEKKFWISKSKYVTYCNCPKAFYLTMKHPELAEISDAQQSRLSAGTAVGDLAMGIFDNKYIDVTSIDENNRLDLFKMIEETKNCISNNVENICEASFLYKNLYCAVDILHKVGDNTFEIYEVKSSTHVEDYHYNDVSFQKYVLTKLGYIIKAVYVVTINSDYVRHGELNINELFKIHDVSNLIDDRVDKVEANLIKMTDLLDLDEPKCELSSTCEHPYQCSFKKYCYKDIPTPSVLDLARCVKKYKFINEGIITFDELKASKYYPKLTSKNKLQVDFELENKELYVDKTKVKKFLDTVTYPLYLLDFETMQQIVPMYDNQRPYQQITFQYSLHYILEKGGEVFHKEFLGKEGTDPRRDLAQSLINDIPGGACVMAYNMSFEKSRIKELAEAYPDLAPKLQALLINFVDLMLPFSNGDVYKKEFQGSYSIKYVLPGLFPSDSELDYHNLDLIHNGSEAMNSFAELANHTPDEIKIIRHSLLKYCELDTYAMVKVLDALYKLVEEGDLNYGN